MGIVPEVRGFEREVVVLKWKSGVEPKSEQRQVVPVLQFGGDYGRAQENGEAVQTEWKWEVRDSDGASSGGHCVGHS